MLTLQVIGEAILSLSAEESDRVFPHLYLPIMEEGNRRSLEPWRAFMPLPALTQRARVRRLNAYIIGVSESCCFYVDATLLLIFPLLNTAGLLKERWGKRQAGQKSVRPDIVDRIMDAIDPAEWGEAAQRQLCYEIKVRSPCVAAQADVPLTRSTVCVQTFILAGHETSASMLTWSLYELSRNQVCVHASAPPNSMIFAPLTLLLARLWRSM